MRQELYEWYVCISYVTSVRYVAGINPEGRVIYSGNVPNRGRDINNLGHEPVAMVRMVQNVWFYRPKKRFKPVSDITLIGS